MQINKMFIVFLFSLLAIASFAQAQNVEKVKGTSVLLNIGDMSVNAGEEYYTLSDTGKKTGLVKISQVKGQHAVAKIQKGAVTEGQTLSLKGKPKETANQDLGDDSPRGISPLHRYKNGGGILLGYSMDTLTMLAADNATPSQHTETATLTGSTIKLKGFYDYGMSDKWTLRMMGGYDGFNGSYSAQSAVINKNNSTTSTLTSSFLSLEGEMQWNFYKRSLTSIWLGAGYSFQYIMSISTNLYSLQLAASYLNSVYVGAGTNIKMSEKSFLPIYLHYNYFVAGSGVSQTSINLGIGWGWAL